MKRREFIRRTAGGISVASSLGGSVRAQVRETDAPRIALAQAEAAIPASLALQAADGGFVIPAYGFAYPASTAAEVARLGAVFCNRDSKYFRDPAIAARISSGIGYLVREQHDDGTIDLPTTNFHSPPDTGFVIEDLTQFYSLLKRDGTPVAIGLMKQAELFIRKAAAAIAGGGIHTPNHRWVASAALAATYSLFRDPVYLKRIDQWLAEGIDCNDDGEYTELSNGVYNRVTNRALMMIAESLDRPALLDPVRRNLSMMMYAVHPDGEVVTDYSRRQDRNTRALMSGYYIPYRALSVRDGNGQFASMADWIVAQAEQGRVSLAGDLAELMLRDELRSEKVVRTDLPTDYARVFAESGVARIRRGNLSATVTSGSPRFFSMRSGSAVLDSVRFASAFFGKGQFVSPKLDASGGVYRLEQRLEGWYNQPLSQGIPNGKWSELPHRQRERSHECALLAVVTIREIRNGFEIKFEAGGTDRVPVVVEFLFRSEGVLQTEGGIVEANGTSFLTSGFARYRSGKDSLTIGPGRADHRWANLRGADPPVPGLVPLTLSGFTPFRHTVRVTVE